MTTTIIDSNGSKWAGQEPDGIDDLLQVLEHFPLNRLFEIYGNFCQPEPKFCSQWGGHNHTSEYEGLTCFSGNFYNLSHTFSLYTDDPEIIRKLTAAIEQNKQRADYLSQDKPVDRSHPYNEDCACIDCRYEANRANCPVCSPVVIPQS